MTLREQIEAAEIVLPVCAKHYDGDDTIDIYDGAHGYVGSTECAHTAAAFVALINKAPALLKVAELVLSTASDTTPPELIAAAEAALKAAGEAGDA
jgi:hypothetical protein